MKKIISFLLVLLMFISNISAGVFAEKTEEEPITEAVTEENGSETENAAAAEEQETFYIKSEEDFLEFASSCGIDSWSLNRKVYLREDLDFTGMEFTPVPVFCGRFYGGGHSISGVEIEADGSHTGVFRYVSETGSVENLKVTGIVTPGGTAVCIGGLVGSNSGTVKDCSFSGTVSGIEQVGGIAGENLETGKISGCSFSGNITGEHTVGGISGMNSGNISACENSGAVNNVSISVSSGYTFDISEITSTFSSEDFLNITDIGGIAGYNSGSILSCSNSGGIGYNRMGYNVGGIAGRSGGCISSCNNTGIINGRKDVGGIAGQLEPYTFWSYSKSKLEEINEQIKQLESLADGAISESQGYNRQLSSTLNEFSAELKTTMAELDTVLVGVEKNSGEVSAALDEINGIASSGESGTATPGDISEIIGEMTGESEPDKLDQITDIVNGIELETPDFGPLTASLSTLADSGSRLTYILSSYAGQLTDSARSLLEQTKNVYAGFADTAEYLKNLDGDYVSDISVQSIDEYASGSISLCSNRGDVSAETNAGGITGAAAVEFSFDVEDELNISDYLFTDPSYMIYAVIRNSESYSDVSAIKSCAGGIAGRMDFGAVGFCTSAGEIKVSSGDYSGGIAGKCVGSIVSCCSRVQLSGEKYVGGIAGEASSIKDCRAYAFVDAADEYFGSVAGSVSGECSGNYFVKNGINGIDNISYSGVAEPLEYVRMAALEDVPDLFKDITVIFKMEDEIIKKVTVSFGGSIEELPEVPSKDGMYWKWDSFNRDQIYYSFTVEGKYCSPISTLTTAEDPPLFLAQGSFYEGQELKAIPYSPDGNADEFSPETVIQAYTLDVSDAEETLTFRMRAEEDGTLYILNQDGSYSPLDFQRDGSYIVFEMQNGSTVVLVREQKTSVVSALVCVLAAAAGVALIVCLVLLRKRKNKKLMDKEKNNGTGNS